MTVSQLESEDNRARHTGAFDAVAAGKPGRADGRRARHDGRDAGMEAELFAAPIDDRRGGDR